MSANRRRRLDNTVPVGAFSPWLIVAAIAILGGVTRVYYRNQLTHRGDSITKMESELAALNRKNDTLKNRIAQLTTYSALQRCFNEGTIKMVKIAPANIVHVNFPGGNRAGGAEIRTVANEGGSRP